MGGLFAYGVMRDRGGIKPVIVNARTAISRSVEARFLADTTRLARAPPHERPTLHRGQGNNEQTRQRVEREHRRHDRVAIDRMRIDSGRKIGGGKQHPGDQRDCCRAVLVAIDEQLSEPSPRDERLERALEKQGSGPYFNGERYSLVDAAYAPFLQRYFFLDRLRRLGHIEKFPRLEAWADALIKRESTHSFPPAEFEALYLENVRRRGKWISQFVESPKVAAE